MRSRPVFPALFGALVCGQLLYPAVPPRRQPEATRAVVALMLLTSAAEAARARGAPRALALLASAGSIGFGAELVGTSTGRPFGPYSYSGRLGPRVRGVPLAAAAAWAMMARPAWVVGGLLSPSPPARVLASASALCAWDVFLDPRMVRDGYWRWERPGRYEDVPVTNYVGWMLTGLVLFSGWSLLERERPAARDDGALVQYLWTFAGETVANLAVWRRPRVALAGGLAMGLHALPAALRRWRARRT